MHSLISNDPTGPVYSNIFKQREQSLSYTRLKEARNGLNYANVKWNSLLIGIKGIKWLHMLSEVTLKNMTSKCYQ